MSLTYWIAWRYIITKRKEKFLWLISIIAILGVVVGVAALMVVIAVMSGFSQDLRDKIIGNYSHLTITAESGIENPQVIIEQLNSISEIQGLSPFIAAQALLEQGENIFAVKIRGIEPATVSEVGKLNDYLFRGNLSQLDTEGVIIGKEMARVLGLDMGESLRLQVSPQKVHNLKVQGIFSSGMYEYDSELVFLHIDKAKQMLNTDSVTGIAVKLNDLNLAEKVKSKIQNLVGYYPYQIRTWIEANQNFFAALKLEKITMFIILSLIILVAAFNIISTLVVMVVQKTKDIGILKAIGMSPAWIFRIFTYEGLMIGLIGTVGGLGLGWLVCFLLKKYQFVRLPSDIYYIDRLPVVLNFWPDVVLIIATALVITVLSTIYPALRAGRLNTVDALRYE